MYNICIAMDHTHTDFIVSFTNSIMLCLENSMLLESILGLGSLLV